MRSLPPGIQDKPDLKSLLWKHKLNIALVILALAVVVLAASTYYFYDQSNDRAAALGNKSSDFDALSLKFYNLSGEHAALIASDKNLTERYESLSSRYDALSSNASSVAADYRNLSATVDQFQEHGAVVALAYTVSRKSTPDGSRVFVNATVYNVGDSRADSISIKCKVIMDNQPDMDEHFITDLKPLDKKSISWNYSSLADIDAVWI